MEPADATTYFALIWMLKLGSPLEFATTPTALFSLEPVLDSVETVWAKQPARFEGLGLTVTVYF